MMFDEETKKKSKDAFSFFHFFPSSSEITGTHVKNTRFRLLLLLHKNKEKNVAAFFEHTYEKKEVTSRTDRDTHHHRVRFARVA